MEENTKYPLLNSIDSPADLRKLHEKQLPRLCDELRAFIIDSLANNPGHFASSLGSVELTVALHYVFSTPDDKLVWDVGHQAYGHKILTGRRNRFHTNRKFGGIKPFPSPEESEYDSFVAGHASNSISAALGLAVSAGMKGSNEHVVAIIGDGSMSGGLAYEGLNNLANAHSNLLIILNDNNMSIDKSVGGMSELLISMHSSKFYNKVRYAIARGLRRIGLLNERRASALTRFNNGLKAMLFRQNNFFEGMSARYFGPINGHNVLELVRMLRSIKDMTGPRMLHIHTVKGKGWEPAEKNATLWHQPGIFDVETGERIVSEGGSPRFQDVFGETLVELAKMNSSVVGVTPAMPTGCSMNKLQAVFPERFFDVGIAEGHAVTFSAGLAKGGMLPFCNIYSSFMQRGYDNLIHDAALQKLDMVLCLDRAGIVGEDGPTHHGAFDLAYLRPVPNITISSPYDERELRRLMYTAAQPGAGTFVIRYPRGKGELLDWRCPLETVEVGTGRLISDGSDVALLTIGPIGKQMERVVAEAAKLGVSVAHYDMRFLKPIDEALLHAVGKKFSRVVTLEDGTVKGGLGSAVVEFMAANGYSPTIKVMGIPDAFVEHGTPAELYKICGMDNESILAAILGMMGAERK
ncbi:MAG: 1-deoxy-D-xylulose-5-phosphate synthase [Bacteroidaceae bacterium]|nr:1-deoxy-D-xylulose-5-phosphate synthase [Bacteroidaceae bacterium]